MKALKTVLLLFVVSRLIIFGFLSIGQSDTVHYADNQLKLDNPILDRFILYDSYNYAQIAAEGYTEDRLTAFFPLFPLIVRACADVTRIDVYWAGFVLSNFFFVCSLWLLYQLMAKRGFSERVRILTLSVLAFFPSSYFFSAFYTESFFLFLALLAFRFWENEKRQAAYVIGGLAALTRLVGVWIPLAFFMERLIRRKLDFKDVACAFMSALMFFIYPVYLRLAKGDPLLFINVDPIYYGRHSTIPFFPVYQDIVWSIEDLKETGWIFPITFFHFILIIIFIGYILSTVHLYRKGRNVIWSEFFYTFGLIVFPLSSILMLHNHVAMHGLMRYFLTIFPLFLFQGKHVDQALTLANKKSGNTYYIGWKLIIYTSILIWMCISGFIFLFIFLFLRHKGFVA
jgi:Gpi18-like mannosyltransferase